jgi:hypothetical protein
VPHAIELFLFAPILVALLVELMFWFFVLGERCPLLERLYW